MIRQRFPEVFELKPAARLQLIGELCESLEAEDALQQLTSAQKKELDRRRKEFLENPSAAIPWARAKRLIRGRHARQRAADR